MMQFPKIIQGGMGVGVSNWRLANAVSKLGQLGVVSGTALDSLFVRRLADGDKGGNMRRGLDAFPFPEMAKRIWDEYYVPGGKAEGVPFPLPPMHQRRDLRKVVELCIVSNFVEVYLAREGHKNAVGINFLEKVQMPHLSSIYGAMLAGVGYVLMGAGIPLHIPGVLDAFAAQHPAEYRLSGHRRGPGCRTRPCASIPQITLKDRFLFSTGHAFWPSSAPTPWPLPCCAGPAGASMGWSSKAPRRADTMRRRAASCCSTLPASRSMASATR
jgi:NAD(P)H-dependent flavin oxidoreductase YrpB (nitropropane dioxygenase family)